MMENPRKQFESPTRTYAEAVLDRLTVLGRDAVAELHQVEMVRDHEGEPAAYSMCADAWNKIQAVLDVLEQHIDRCDQEAEAEAEEEAKAARGDATYMWGRG